MADYMVPVLEQKKMQNATPKSQQNPKTNDGTYVRHFTFANTSKPSERGGMPDDLEVNSNRTPKKSNNI